jgi:hypothetical protein
MEKERVIQAWAGAGVEDFYLSFELQSRWTKQSNFYCQQGLEKICKAYHLGKCSRQWMGLPDELALKTIHQIA